jgi:hypothetical protein
MSAEHWSFLFIAGLLEALRSFYSQKFYQEIDWHCYSHFARLFLSGEYDYAKYVLRKRLVLFFALMSPAVISVILAECITQLDSSIIIPCFTVLPEIASQPS